MSQSQQEKDSTLPQPCPETQGILICVSVELLVTALTKYLDESCTISAEFGREIQAKDPVGEFGHVEFLDENVARLYRSYRWKELQLRNIKEKERQAECAKREATAEAIAQKEEKRKRWQMERFQRIQSIMKDLRKTPWLTKLGEQVLKMEVECIVDYGADLGNEELMKFIDDNCL